MDAANQGSNRQQLGLRIFKAQIMRTKHIAVSIMGDGTAMRGK